jgi:hypothetical protein
MRSTLACFVVLLALAGAAPALAQSPPARSWRDEVRRLHGARIVKPSRALTHASAPGALSVAAIIAESEPNDSARTADSVALGDQATGVINPRTTRIPGS